MDYNNDREYFEDNNNFEDDFSFEMQFESNPEEETFDTITNGDFGCYDDFISNRGNMDYLKESLGY